MKIPKKITVGHFIHDVSVVKKIKDGGGYGEYDTVSGKIRIREGQSKADMVDTLLHEVLHAIFHRYKIRIDGDAEERIVYELTKAIIKTFRDNPKLVKYISKAVRGVADD